MAPEDKDAGNDAWTWAALEPEPTQRERELLDRFCNEFLVDGNTTQAASRCGFQAAFAKEYGERFFKRSYVQQRLRALKEADPDARAVEKYDRKVIINGLRSIATNEYTISTARVSAIRGMMDFYGIGGTNKKTGLGDGAGHAGVQGGVMAVPAIASLDDWEAAATASQSALAEASRV